MSDCGFCYRWCGWEPVPAKVWSGFLGFVWRDCSCSMFSESVSGVRGYAHNALETRTYCAFSAKFVARYTSVLLSDFDPGGPDLDS